MKRFSGFVAITCAILIAASCGTSSKSSSTQQNAQTSVQQTPGRTLRTEEPCITLANESPFRAYGTAKSYIEQVAINEAARQARAELARMVKTAIEGAAMDYSQNANLNQKGSAETLGETINTFYVAEVIEKSSIIKTDIYDLTDGSIQVYVCVEMLDGTAEEFDKKLDNTLDREGIISTKYDREQFINKVKGGLEEYKKNHSR